MKALGGVGQVGKFPIGIAVANLESGDVTALVGLVKRATVVLSVAGCAAIGLMWLRAIREEAEREKRTRVSLARLAHVSKANREFLGVCDTDVLEFTVDRQGFSVPLDRIRSVKENYTLWSGRVGFDIELLDDSRYLRTKPSTKTLTLTSFAGSQTVHLYDSDGLLYMTGASTQEINDLCNRLRFTVEAQKKNIISELGEEFETIWDSKLRNRG